MLPDIIINNLEALWAWADQAHLPHVVQVFLVMISSFISEDITILTTLVLTSAGHLPPLVFWLGNGLGLVAGDMLLYGAGRAIARHRHKFLGFNLPKLQKQAEKYPVHSFILVTLARFFPGTRLPVYVSAGLSQYSVFLFFVATVLSVGAWVSFVFFAGAEVVALVEQYQSRWGIGLALVLLAYLLLHKAGTLLLILMDPYQRRAWWHGWRRYLYYEFWPGKVLYLPVGFYYAWLTLRYGHLLLPSAANPGIHTGGLIGESKAQIFSLMPRSHSTLLAYERLDVEDERLAKVQAFMAQNQLDFPIILKPDQGQRGGGVTLVRDAAQLETCLSSMPYPVLVQEYCGYAHEAGIFYVSRPGVPGGEVFSVTDKIFPTVTGDGKAELGELILQDPRARLIAATYFRRFEARLHEVVPKGERVRLVESGNHCQGAVFKDGQHLMSPKLMAALDDLVQQIDGFYVGRIDVRYASVAALQRGEFKIIEINGAGAEATHIYDETLTLRQAYRVLFAQWRLMFEIGHALRQQGQRPISVFGFIQTVFKYMWMARHYRIAS